MRLPVRRLASTTLSAFLLLGVTGPVALATGGDTHGGQAAAVAKAPVADAETLLAQTQSLGNLSEVLKPTTELLQAVLKADSGRLTPQESAQHSTAVKDAIAKIGAKGTTTMPAPVSATGATTLPAPASAKAATGSDVAADALAELQKSVETLLQASTAGDAAQVRPAANNVVTDLVNVVAVTLTKGSLPAPDMAALPTSQQQPTSEQSTSEQSTSEATGSEAAGSATAASEQQAPELPATEQAPAQPASE